MKTSAATALLAGGTPHALPAVASPGSGYHLRTDASGALVWARTDSLAINGTVYNLAGALPNVGGVANRLGTVHASALNLASTGTIVAAGQNPVISFGLNDVNFTTAHIIAGYSVGLRGFRGTTAGMDSVAGGARVSLYAGGALGLSVLNSGNVGIGIPAPDLPIEKLDVIGNLSLRNGATPTSINLHGTYTDASNYERLRTYVTGGNYVIAAEAAGTGVVRNLSIQPTAGVLTLGNATNGVTTNGVLSIAGNTATCRISPSSNLIRVTLVGSGKVFDWSVTQGFSLPSNIRLGWSPDTTGTNTDTYISRYAANVIVVGTGNTSGLRVGTIGLWGTTPPAAQPATPVDLAGVISLLQSYGMCA